MIKKELSELTQQIDQELQKIDDLLANELVEAAYSEYINLVKKIESTEYKDIDIQYKAKAFISFLIFCLACQNSMSFLRC